MQKRVGRYPTVMGLCSVVLIREYTLMNANFLVCGMRFFNGKSLSNGLAI